MKIDASKFSQKFQDMRLRIINHGYCPIEFKLEEAGCWPYGTLFYYFRYGHLIAAFGDLAIPVTIEEALILANLATKPMSTWTDQY